MVSLPIWMQEPAHGLLTDDTPRDPDLIILV